jgi:hypothetical protein
MRMNPGELWRCCNQSCLSEIRIHAPSADGANPRCACGSPMKKDYKPPVFRYLEFLRLQDPDRVPARRED